MVQTIKKMLSEQFEAFSRDSGGLDYDLGNQDQLDLLEQGLTSLYNPNLL